MLRRDGYDWAFITGRRRHVHGHRVRDVPLNNQVGDRRRRTPAPLPAQARRRTDPGRSRPRESSTSRPRIASSGNATPGSAPSSSLPDRQRGRSTGGRRPRSSQDGIDRPLDVRPVSVIRPRRRCASPCRRARWCRRASRCRPPGRGRRPRGRPRPRRLAAGSNRTSTWFRTTSFRIATPGSPRAPPRTAARRAQQRSTRSAMPARPSERSAAQTAKPRARRENSGDPVERSRSPPLGLDEVGGGERHRRPVRLRVAHDRRCRESYGTLSHLWASVAHESARSTPRARCAQRRARRRPQPERAVHVQPAAGARGRARDDLRRAGRTRRCSRCPPARRRGRPRRAGQDLAQRRPRASAPARRRRPRSPRSRPSPSIWSAARIVTCASAPTTTRSPARRRARRASTSQPARSRTA